MGQGDLGAAGQRADRAVLLLLRLVPDDDVPLILWTDKGYAARFCKQCRKTWWGFQEFDEEFDA